jgi:hypothetical protein
MRLPCALTGVPGTGGSSSSDATGVRKASEIEKKKTHRDGNAQPAEGGANTGKGRKKPDTPFTYGTWRPWRSSTSRSTS